MYLTHGIAHECSALPVLAIGGWSDESSKLAAVGSPTDRSRLDFSDRMIAVRSEPSLFSTIYLLKALTTQATLLKNSPLCLLKRQNVGRSNKAWGSKRASLTKADLTKNSFIKFCQIMESRQ